MTPAQTEGPFYPDKLPLDTDNDLLILNDAVTPALGEITWLNGRILDSRGEPIRNAVVEIWQCDAKGVIFIVVAAMPRNATQIFRALVVSHQLKRGISIPHHQARALSRTHAAHSLCNKIQGPRQIHDAVLHPGRAAQ